MFKAAQKGHHLLPKSKTVQFELGSKEAMPKEKEPGPFVDSTSLSNLLGSVFSFKFGDEKDLNVLLEDEESKSFTLDFLTKFMLKGYAKKDE